MCLLVCSDVCASPATISRLDLRAGGGSETNPNFHYHIPRHSFNRRAFMAELPNSIQQQTYPGYTSLARFSVDSQNHHQLSGRIESRDLYVEEKIFKYLKNWFTERQVWKRLKNVMRPISIYILQLTRMSDLLIQPRQFQNYSRSGSPVLGGSTTTTNDENYDQQERWYSYWAERRWRSTVLNNDIDELPVQEAEIQAAYAKLIRMLKLSKLFNAIMTMCHGLLLVRALDLDYINYLTWQGRSHFGQNFQDNFLWGESTVDVDTRLVVEADSIDSNTNNNSAGNLPTMSGESGICYHLLIVSLLDFLNSLFWYHSKESIVKIDTHKDTICEIKFRLRRVSWLKSTLDMLLSPKHLFQIVYIGLFVGVGSLRGSTGILISLYNSLNQIVRHGYNLYRVVCYHELLVNTLKSTASRQNQPFESTPTPLAGAAGAERNNNNTIDVYHDQNVELLHYEVDNNMIDESYEQRSSRCLAKSDEEMSAGWSRWPIKLYKCACEFRGSFRYRFERVMMMSQMLAIKVTIFALLLRIDSQSLSINSFEGFVLFACLVESFMAMYFYYDKYYSRYLERHNLLKQKLA